MFGYILAAFMAGVFVAYAHKRRRDRKMREFIEAHQLEMEMVALRKVAPTASTYRASSSKRAKPSVRSYSSSSGRGGCCGGTD